MSVNSSVFGKEAGNLCKQCVGQYPDSPVCELLPACEYAQSVIFKAVNPKEFKLAALLNGVKYEDLSVMAG